MKYLAIFLGGSMGAGLRYILSLLLNVYPFPLGTFTANLFGAFLMGFCATTSLRIVTRSPHIKKAITTGFIGAFTTFSTFQFELVSMAQQCHWALLLLYMMLSYVGGLVFCYIGYRLGGSKQ
ncbi:fluoride efflux transporter CrcB [Staphylococcus americanisciuri]|uniref:Fluoride-specific ion channel FluC n=1 Tax=Staphylococcus americanisciuri TaxID=2973940 RepID=A0ABT2EYC3_9STAP|nr:fluoride efflux transporter CrcB [Staphylococcus americanisciuri]MCS4485285.1 fluoride efflux transporter CrcB [Staphylococcus americanisciuri]